MEDFDQIEVCLGPGGQNMKRKSFCISCDDGRKPKNSNVSGPVKFSNRYLKSTKKKICPVCGTEFEGGARKMCSPTCQVAQMKINQHKSAAKKKLLIKNKENA